MIVSLVLGLYMPRTFQAFKVTWFKNFKQKLWYPGRYSSPVISPGTLFLFDFIKNIPNKQGKASQRQLINTTPMFT